MKKAVLLNSPATVVISQLGHTNSLCVCDAGLPIPPSVERIDLAVSRNIPPFFDVFDAITSEMCVERVVIAEEMREKQPVFHQQVCDRLAALAQEQGNPIAIDYIAHEALKTESAKCRAIIRSGECTPYANVILYAGVTF